MSLWPSSWDPKLITVANSSVSNVWKQCVLQNVIGEGGTSTDGLGGRIASIFVIFVTSMFATLVPVLLKKSKNVRIPEYCYVTAKNFGTGVIVSTAFIHLLDPAYIAIGRRSCVGQTGTWRSFRWCATMVLAGAICTFMVDIYCSYFSARYFRKQQGEKTSDELEFQAQFSGFVILEFGVVVHSAFIGLALGSSSNWIVLFIVIIFHQMFEGLGIGARMSMIPFPGKKWFWPYLLSFAYSVTTPISIAIGLGVRESYREYGFNQLRVQGICDALSCGIMMYTAFVELLARDFVFEPGKRTLKDLNIQVFFLLLGALIMSVIGKWA